MTQPDEFIGGDSAGELFPRPRRPDAIRLITPGHDDIVIDVPPLSELSFDPVAEDRHV